MAEFILAGAIITPVARGQSSVSVSLIIAFEAATLNSKVAPWGRLLSLDTESCVFLRVRERNARYDNRGGQDAKRRSLYWLNTTMRHPRGETSSSAFSTRMEIVIRRKNELRTEYANQRLP